MRHFDKYEIVKIGGLEIPLFDPSAIKRKWLDLAYANLSESQKLDIYLPDEGDGPFPVVLFIHGGFFYSGDKRDLHAANFLIGLQRGYALVSVNYRLSDEAIFPAGIQDVKAAIRWLRANKARYHLDTNRIGACGGSSGGNFAAILCLAGHVSEFEDARLGNPDYPSDIQAAVDIFGPIDFSTMDRQLEENGYGPGGHWKPGSPESRYLGGKLSDVPVKVQLANPMTFIHKNMPPLLIQHGRLDSDVPIQQSIDFVEKLERFVPPDRFEFDLIEGAGHGDGFFESKANMDRIFSFFDKHLK